MSAQTHPTAAELSQAQRDSAAAARTRAELDRLRNDTDSNPGAAVAFVALTVLILMGAAGIAGFMWLFLQVAR